jgi:superfamily II DNA or RNA helicase
VSVDVRVDTFAWLPKSELSSSQIDSLRRELTVIPKTMVADEDTKPLLLYRETASEFGLPRAYFYKHKRPSHNVIPNWTLGLVDLHHPIGEFTASLRPEQQQCVDAAINSEYGLGGMIKAAPGWGKCLSPDTPVLLYSGKVVRADEVVEGDTLMGPDSTPRRVLSTTCGRSAMYRIVPKIGPPWECNYGHILTLVESGTGRVTDMAVEDYLALHESKRVRFKLFSPENGVSFGSEEEELPIDPYFLGVWYGDGTKSLQGVSITNPDKEIQDLCLEIANQYGLRVRTGVDSRNGSITHFLVTPLRGCRNPLLDLLRRVVGDASEIPFQYLTASKENRRRFLAGFLDTDGHNNNGCLRIVQKRKAYAEGVAFIARSLGIRATIKRKPVSGVDYWRVNMAGDFSQLPLRIPRKQPGPRLQRKVATRQGFNVLRIGDGDYAGFTLSGDGRFLLGDFTVTHNTVASLAIVSHYNLPTLILVHRGFLMDQWAERIAQFLPSAKVGRIQQNECSYRGKSIVIGMVHSVVSGKYDPAFYEWPGVVLTDEAHRTGARTWYPAQSMFRAKYRFGVTATPRRKDKAENAFYYSIGPILFAAKAARLSPKIRRVWTPFKFIKTTKFNPSLAPRSLMIRFLLGSKMRNRLIVEQLVEAVKVGRKCLVVSEQLKHLAALESLFLEEWPLDQGFSPGIGYYVGGRSKSELAEAAKAQIIFATSQYASEGLDIPPLDTLLLASPWSDVDQAVGRILRPFPGKKDPVVVDFRDDEVRQFRNQGLKREAYYSKVTA